MSTDTSADLRKEIKTIILVFIGTWVHDEKTPVPLKAIVAHMETEGVRKLTTINTLKALTKKGYIRRAQQLSNTTSYIQMRSFL